MISVLSAIIDVKFLFDNVQNEFISNSCFGGKSLECLLSVESKSFTTVTCGWASLMKEDDVTDLNCEARLEQMKSMKCRSCMQHHGIQVQWKPFWLATQINRQRHVQNLVVKWSVYFQFLFFRMHVMT